MSDLSEAYIRWSPLPDLPEHPCETAWVEYDGRGLVATAIYAIDPPVDAVRIRFGRVEAFKVYEEFSDPWMENPVPQPVIDNPKLNSWTYPLQEVTNSRWVARVCARNGGLAETGWKHHVIVTMDVTLHVMLSGELEGVELVPKLNRC